mgnify:CR=1 FL=1
MSFTTVLRDDFTNTRRSYVVLGVIGALTAFVALIVHQVADFHEDAFRALVDVSFFFFLVFPLILIPLTYLAVAGDRERGSIKHALGLPNTRAEYVAAKFVSRASVATAAVVVATTVAFLLGLALYTDPVDPLRFVRFAAITALFVASLTAVFVALSTVTSRRSRAMFGVIAAYFVLGPFWFGFLPIVNLQAVVDTVADLLGTSVSEETFGYIQFASPTTAYLGGLEPVYEGVIGTGEYERIDGNYVSDTDALYTNAWYHWLVMTVWGVGALGLAYARFRVAELG